MVSWIIEGVLATSARPGYRPGAETVVPRSTIDAWVEAAQAAGVRSIICLLGEDQLPLYLDALPEGLLNHYQHVGFEVAHVAARDGLTEPYSSEQLQNAWLAFQRLARPVLVHCSAGHDRAGRVVRHLLSKLEAEGGGH